MPGLGEFAGSLLKKIMWKIDKKSGVDFLEFDIYISANRFLIQIFFSVQESVDI